MKNQLKQAFSPYLLQHANNPVFWQIWNGKNLNIAKENHRLLIISIGYAACHWCHVMEKECFEDVEVAQVMNKHFTSFKLDREELPAVDAYYMQALQLMTQQGGWPLNIVALPDGRPVWGATYVSKDQWIDVLEQLASLYQTNPDKMYEYAEKLNNGISLANNPLEIYPKSKEKINLSVLIENWQKSFDLEFGGYSRAPKFMMPTNLNFLYRYGVFTSNEKLTQHVERTLTKMAYGGLFDVLEGGFSRYSVDHRWHIPHFEKMLYDNAQLLSTYSRAYLRTKNTLYKEIVEKTVGFILNNWQDSSGGFYAAFDADSKNTENIQQEGAYYFWKKEDLDRMIPNREWHLFQEVFSINEEGFWDEAHAYVLFQSKDLGEIASQNNISLEELKQLKSNWEIALLKERCKRSKPLLDDKIIISWNALLLSGFLDAQKILSDNKLNLAIKKLAGFLQHHAYQEDKLGRVYKNHQVYIKGTLEDYAATIKAFIDLFQISQDIAHIQYAYTLTLQTLDFFYDTTQGFFKSTNDLFLEPVFEIEDNVIPSANALMSSNLFYLGFIFQNNYFSEIPKEMTQRVLNQINYASAFSEWLLNDLIFEKNFEYLIIKDPSEEELHKIHSSNPNIFIMDYSLNLPILEPYKNQNKRIQICNLTSCRLQTDNINDILN